MIERTFLLRLAAAITLALVAGGSHAQPAARTANHAAEAGKWTIGPIIRGRNYSVRMPLHPTPRRGGGFAIDLPRAPGSVHYVTFRHGPLTGKTRIVMRYRVEAEPGARIVASSQPGYPGMITPYFQRAGDSWSGKGRFEAYRWYATFATKTPIEPGEHRIVAPLNADWTAVETSRARARPAPYRAALAEAERVGFVLGGGDGYGHGVHVEGGGARLVVTEFRVE